MSGLPIPISRTLMVRLGSPTNVRSIATSKNIDLHALGHAAARETMLTSTSAFAGVWTDLFSGLLVPNHEFRFMGRGPGVGKDAYTAFSGLMGRFLVRAYLEQHQGVRVLVPLDVAKARLKPYHFRIGKLPSEQGDEADWIGLDDNGVVIVEAKGTYNSAIGRWRGPDQWPKIIDEQAREQAKRTRVFDEWSQTDVTARRWAVASRWGTEENSRDTTIAAWDPVDDASDEGVERLSRLLLEIEADELASELVLEPQDRRRRDPLQREGVRFQVSSVAIGLRIRDRPVSRGAVTAFDARGMTRVRGAADLQRVRDARASGASIVLASLAEDYSAEVGEVAMLDTATESFGEATDEFAIWRRQGLTVAWLPPGDDPIGIEIADAGPEKG